MQYLMIDGHGDPNSSQEFTDAVQALYPVAYKLKFANKTSIATTSSRRWKGCGGRRTWRRSRPPGTSPAGIGLSC